MIPLIDADILRYEIGFAAEAGWRHKTGDPELIPPWDYVENCLHQRIDQMMDDIETEDEPIYYLSGPTNFRNELAVTKPYKGTRPENKPWHFNNLTVYLRDVLNAVITDGIEADDLITIDHLASEGRTIICSRDKDLRQVPGWFYSWELGKQPSFGPLIIPKEGWLKLESPKKLSGCGLVFFYAQCLMGDIVDNVPGLPGCGPVRAFELLNGLDLPEQLKSLCEAYKGLHGASWEEHLLEQGRLLWMTRRLNEDGTPVLWEIGMDE